MTIIRPAPFWNVQRLSARSALSGCTKNVATYRGCSLGTVDKRCWCLGKKCCMDTQPNCGLCIVIAMVLSGNRTDASTLTSRHFVTTYASHKVRMCSHSFICTHTHCNSSPQNNSSTIDKLGFIAQWMMVQTENPSICRMFQGNINLYWMCLNEECTHFFPRCLTS